MGMGWISRPTSPVMTFDFPSSRNSTAFTPNHDNVNETFKVIADGIDPSSYKMVIYNRWGELVFSSNNLKVGWDGSIKGNPHPKDGVYAYKITLVDVFGNKHEYVGHVYCQVVDRE